MWADRPSRQALKRTAGSIRWGTLGYLPAAVAYARLRRRLGAPRPVSVLVVAGAPVAVARALPSGRGRAAAVWLAHMWAYKVAFETPFDCPQKLHERLHVDYPIRVDRLIGLGAPPGQRLQRRLRRPPVLSKLDKAMTFVYLLWEIEPHAALAWILLRHPERFAGAALRLGVTYDLTLIAYYLVPTAPPWWASEKGERKNGDVHRVTVEVIRHLRGKQRPAHDHEEGANPWAAMPSDHFASALSAAIALGQADTRAGALGLTYALTLGSALVYTGEHYVTDLLAGLALALGVHEAGTLATGRVVRAAELLAGSESLRERLAG